MTQKCSPIAYPKGYFEEEEKYEQNKKLIQSQAFEDIILWTDYPSDRKIYFRSPVFSSLEAIINHHKRRLISLEKRHKKRLLRLFPNFYP